MTIQTPRQIYNAALDSVKVIQRRIRNPYLNQTEEERREEIQRNSDHLEIVLAKDVWTTEDLTPLINAVEAAKKWLSGESTLSIDLDTIATIDQRLRAAETLINLILNEEDV